MHNVRVGDLVNCADATQKISLAALLSRPKRILLGGVWAASGVLAMHYVGMTAQRTHASMHMWPPLVVVSALIALVAASAAFWIIFRLVSELPRSIARFPSPY